VLWGRGEKKKVSLAAKKDRWAILTGNVASTDKKGKGSGKKRGIKREKVWRGIVR